MTIRGVNFELHASVSFENMDRFLSVWLIMSSSGDAEHKNYANVTLQLLLRVLADLLEDCGGRQWDSAQDRVCRP